MTYYINYTYGSPARISEHPCLTLTSQLSSSDVNILSQIITSFNDKLKDAQLRRKKRRTEPVSFDDSISLLRKTAFSLL